MPKKKVILVCGVSGSGKTWVCKQLASKFAYVPHDEHYDNIYAAITKASKTDQSVITEVPFAERVLRENLERVGYEVIPVFVIEDADLIAERYLKREGKPIQKAAYTRASTIVNRADEWDAYRGTSAQVLAHLRHI